MTPAEDLARLRHYMTDTESPGYGQGYDAKGHTTTPAEERIYQRDRQRERRAA